MQRIILEIIKVIGPSHCKRPTGLQFHFCGVQTSSQDRYLCFDFFGFFIGLHFLGEGSYSGAELRGRFISFSKPCSCEPFAAASPSKMPQGF